MGLHVTAIGISVEQVISPPPLNFTVPFSIVTIVYSVLVLFMDAVLERLVNTGRTGIEAQLDPNIPVGYEDFKKFLERSGPPRLTIAAGILSILIFGPWFMDLLF